MNFDINQVIQKLAERRKIFVSEADFQLEMAWTIRENYPESEIYLEFCPPFNPNLHLDILVILDDKWYPIELKYKKKGCQKTIGNRTFILKEDAARDIGCYLYLKDIQRIESIKENVKEFATGYTIILTNDLGYTVKPHKENCTYQSFTIEEGATKTGELTWRSDSLTSKISQVKDPIILTGTYPMHWQLYSKLDDSNSGTLKYIINEIK